jgi:hypothetical protein
MRRFMEKVLGVTQWRKEWQEDLSTTLSAAQKGLSVSMVVVIARESDLYSEVLYLFSFIGLSVGFVSAFIAEQSFGMKSDLLMLPLLGFAMGSTLFAFRGRFISRVAPKAIRDRVAHRAKSLFFDHYQHLKGKLALLYFSELEREALFLTSPELVEKTPSKEIQALLSKLIVNYNPQDPMLALRPALTSLGQLLRLHYGEATPDAPVQDQPRSPIYVGASDLPQPFQIPILKGNKDVN